MKKMALCCDFVLQAASAFACVRHSLEGRGQAVTRIRDDPDRTTAFASQSRAQAGQSHSRGSLEQSPAGAGHPLAEDGVWYGVPATHLLDYR